MHNTEITDVVFDKAVDGPACVDISTGVLYINPLVWKKLSQNQRNFILLHEIGHRKFKTLDETIADNFAVASYKSMGYPAPAALKAHLSQLNPNNPEHVQRANNVYYQLEAINKQNKMRALNTINQKQASFLDFGKAALERREESRDKRQEARLERINARQSGRAAQAAAGGGWQTAVGGILSSLGGAFGLGGGAATADQSTDNNNQQSSGGNTLMYVGIAIAVIVVIYFATKKKK